MGMFNSIFADLNCPKMQTLAAHAEIQIKWQALAARRCEAYYIGSELDDILPEYNNAWIRTDSICSVCSKLTTGKNGVKYIQSLDQQRHVVFVRIDAGIIQEIISVEETRERGIGGYVDDVFG